MGLFSKKSGGIDIKKAGTVKIKALVAGEGGQCPYCKAELQTIIDQEAQPVYDVFRRMGPVAGSVTMDTAREQVLKQGLACSCGKEIRSFAK